MITVPDLLNSFGYGNSPIIDRIFFGYGIKYNWNLGFGIQDDQ